MWKVPQNNQINRKKWLWRNSEALNVSTTSNISIYHKVSSTFPTQESESKRCFPTGIGRWTAGWVPRAYHTL